MVVWEKGVEEGNDLPKRVVNNSQAVSLDAFAATEFNEIFLGGQPHQKVKIFQRPPSSGSAGGLVEPRPISFGSTKPPALPEYGYRVISRNVVKHSHLDGAVCPRKIN
jgi:hypothetical protein